METSIGATVQVVAQEEDTGAKVKQPTRELVPLAAIKAGFQHRSTPCDRSAVAASTAELGPLDEPHVWEVETGSFRTLVGHGRIEIQKERGESETWCKVWRGISENKAKKIALDSNLARNDLALGDLCRAWAEREKVYKEEFPPHPGTSSTTWTSFVETFAQSNGFGRTKLYNMIRIGKYATPATIEALNLGTMTFTQALAAIGAEPSPAKAPESPTTSDAPPTEQEQGITKLAKALAETAMAVSTFATKRTDQWSTTGAVETDHWLRETRKTINAILMKQMPRIGGGK